MTSYFQNILQKESLNMIQTDEDYTHQKTGQVCRHCVLFDTDGCLHRDIMGEDWPGNYDEDYCDSFQEHVRKRHSLDTFGYPARL